MTDDSRRPQSNRNDDATGRPQDARDTNQQRSSSRRRRQRPMDHHGARTAYPPPLPPYHLRPPPPPPPHHLRHWHLPPPLVDTAQMGVPVPPPPDDASRSARYWHPATRHPPPPDDVHRRMGMPPPTPHNVSRWDFPSDLLPQQQEQQQQGDDPVDNDGEGEMSPPPWYPEIAPPPPPPGGGPPPPPPPPFRMPRVLPDTQQELRDRDQVDISRCALCAEYLRHDDMRRCDNVTCTARYCAGCVRRYVSQRRQEQHHDDDDIDGADAMPCPVCRVFTTEFPIDDDQASRRRDEGGSSSTFPCRYAACPHVAASVDDLSLHEDACPHVRVACRFGVMGCPWRGTRRQLVREHVEECAWQPLEGVFVQQGEIQWILRTQVHRLQGELWETRQRTTRLERRMEQLEHQLLVQQEQRQQQGRHQPMQ